MGRAYDVKEKLRAKAYIRHGMNGTKMIQAERPNISYKAATVEATRLLAKPSFQRTLLEEMEKQGLNNDVVVQAHRENIMQRDHLPSRNAALDMFYKIQGAYKETSTILNIHTTPDAVQSRLKELEREVQELDNA